MATMANHDRETTQPTCQNCATSTTPLWRRDEMGAVLCNACGLFLKLHGRPRPISLKTDVIKSRNRVKTMRPDLKQKKQNQALATAGDLNGAADFLNQNNGGAMRRPSQRSANGNPDDTNSPISRTGTPGIYSAAQMAPMYHNIDDQFQAQQLAGFGLADGRAPSPMNGERLDLPQTHEQLLQANGTLKTRVSELEVIQELYRGRIQQLEQEENMRQVQEAGKPDDQLQAQVAALTESNAQLRRELDESHHRENMLKRRLDELEVELETFRRENSNKRHLDEVEAGLEAEEQGVAKKPRLDEEALKPEEPSEPAAVPEPTPAPATVSES